MKPLSCHYIVGRSRIILQEKELPHFFNQKTRLLATRLCGYYSRAAFISSETPQTSMEIRYVQAIQRRLLDAGSSTRNLSALLSAVEKSCTTRTALVLTRNRRQNYSHTCACAACCCGYYSRVGSSLNITIAFTRLLLLLQLLLSAKNLTSREVKARNSLHFCLTKKFSRLNALLCMI